MTWETLLPLIVSAAVGWFLRHQGLFAGGGSTTPTPVVPVAPSAHPVLSAVEAEMLAIIRQLATQQMAPALAAPAVDLATPQGAGASVPVSVKGTFTPHPAVAVGAG